MKCLLSGISGGRRKRLPLNRPACEYTKTTSFAPKHFVRQQSHPDIEFKAKELTETLYPVETLRIKSFEKEWDYIPFVGVGLTDKALLPRGILNFTIDQTGTKACRKSYYGQIALESFLEPIYTLSLLSATGIDGDENLAEWSKMKENIIDDITYIRTVVTTDQMTETDTVQPSQGMIGNKKTPFVGRQSVCSIPTYIDVKISDQSSHKVHALKVSVSVEYIVDLVLMYQALEQTDKWLREFPATQPSDNLSDMNMLLLLHGKRRSFQIPLSSFAPWHFPDSAHIAR